METNEHLDIDWEAYEYYYYNQQKKINYEITLSHRKRILAVN